MMHAVLQRHGPLICNPVGAGDGRWWREGDVLHFDKRVARTTASTLVRRLARYPAARTVRTL